MQAKLTSLAVSFALLASVGSAQAAFFSGTPSPTLSPTFGILVNFDDKATGTAIGAGDYTSLGVASIRELEGLGFFGRYASSQSGPNYVGTGFGGERGTDAAFGWDGTILIRFDQLVSKVGLGVADSKGTPEIMSIFNSDFIQLETGVVPTGANTYSYFERTQGDIKYVAIKGDFFAIDDLQFSPVPEPSTYVLFGLGLLTLIGFRRRSRKSA